MQAKKILFRNEVPEEFKWNLKDIYPSDQAWEDDFKALQELIPGIQNYRGKLGQTESLIACLQLQVEIGKKLDKLIGYAMRSKDQDNTNNIYQEFSDKILSVLAVVAARSAYIEPEILNLPGETVTQWIEENQELTAYKHYLDNIIRMKPHTLPAEQEELLASAGEMAQTASNIFSMFNNADLKFSTIEDEQGNKVELSHGRYIQFMESKNRRVRRDAFQAMYSTYSNWKNTLAATYTSAVKKTKFFATARKYNSALEAALNADNVPPQVYYNLIDSVHNHLPEFYRYVDLRKRLLELDELHMYDIYVPIVKDIDIKIPPQEAMDTVKKGLAPLGQQYTEDLAKGFAGRWIDWFENVGKTSGAYSAGVFGVHPYVLLNYNETFDNMFTLAHEMGHAMHSFYASQKQEYINSRYTIFVAEVASTVNECLLMHHLLEETDDVQKRMYLLNHYLEQFRGTVFRQTMFAEFEMIVHEQIGQGNPMTAEGLSKTYYELNQKYYGPNVVSDEDIAMEWARIPHFYRPFYVYKYATGFSAAVALTEQIINHKEPAVTRYLEFLNSGGSDYPLNQLKKAGVDMTVPNSINNALGVFKSLVDEMEDLITEYKK